MKRRVFVLAIFVAAALSHSPARAAEEPPFEDVAMQIVVHNHYFIRPPIDKLELDAEHSKAFDAVLKKRDNLLLLLRTGFTDEYKRSQLAQLRAEQNGAQFVPKRYVKEWEPEQKYLRAVLGTSRQMLRSAMEVLTPKQRETWATITMRRAINLDGLRMSRHQFSDEQKKVMDASSSKAGAELLALGDEPRAAQIQKVMDDAIAAISKVLTLEQIESFRPAAFTKE